MLSLSADAASRNPDTARSSENGNRHPAEWMGSGRLRFTQKLLSTFYHDQNRKTCDEGTVPADPDFGSRADDRLLLEGGCSGRSRGDRHAQHVQ